MKATKSTTKKTTAKKPVVKTTRKAPVKKPDLPSKSHSISCDDATWGKIQASAKKAGLNVSKYIISKVMK
ncbi:MAG: hypothetical protein M0P01_12740 [Treponema sp.]|nr:hypothetical protein [Treponema sp.]